MSEDKSYELTVRSDEAEYFLGVAQSYLEEEGFEVKVHLHEPPNQMEIFEFARDEESLSVEINRHELDACMVRIASPSVDPYPLVLGVVSELCVGLVSTFVKPMLEAREGVELEARVRAALKGILEGTEGE